ncbi:hypothetical protein [Nodosilinea nodulosa]|uniref:phosphorylase family protein n=1 Tax=Nodosilinea nodulosa TaxID=416001 RepID=UPI000474B5C6|nr:hypothetical protein [Nodosilinea nodulosa]
MPLAAPAITTLLVPQGAEYAAVCRGLKPLKKAAIALPQVVPIPVGGEAVTARLKALELPPGGCLVMGLGGSLSPALGVGAGVIGQRCLTVVEGSVVGDSPGQPSPDLVGWMQDRLGHAAGLGTVVTSDRILTTAAAKAALHHLTQADVVDMESSAVIAALAPHPVAILRVISDDYDQTLPDITAALGANGDLKPWPLVKSFIQQPGAAAHLIAGSLRGLRRLEALTHQLFV